MSEYTHNPPVYPPVLMATQKKLKRVWGYLSEDDQNRLAKLVESVGGGLNEAQVLSVLASAALKACSEAGNRVPLPLKFSLAEVGDPQLNEQRITKYPQRK